MSTLKGGVLAALLSGALFVLCQPGMPCPWLAWVVMVPLLFQLRQMNGRGGFFIAGLFGWAMWFGSVWWLHAPLHDMLDIPIGSALFMTAIGCGLMALPYAIAGAIICRWQRAPGIISAARDAAILTLTVTWLTPIFHGNIAHTQYRYPIILQVLELGGTPLLLFIMLWVNALLAEALLLFRSGIKPVKLLLTAAFVFATVLLYGGVRMSQFGSEMKAAPAGQWFTVGAIQPNIPIGVDASRQPAPHALPNDFYTAIEQAAALARAHPEIDLLAFPENPATFLFNQDTARRQALGHLIGITHKPVMLNADAVEQAKTGESTPRRYNVALLMDAEKNLAGNYAKTERIPLVEYIPGETQFPWLRKLLPKSQRVLQGTGLVTFDAKPGVHVIPLICYEGIFSSLTRQFVRKGGNFIINQVNDSWFLRTPASETHLALTLFRTIEYRVPLVRVTNAGIGAHIQANGQIVEGSRTLLFTKTETAVPLYIPPKRSVYAVIENWWMLGFALLLLRFPLRNGEARPTP